MSRLTFITLLSIVSILLAIVLRYQGESEEEALAARTSKNAEPDFYLANARSVQFDKSGSVRYSFTANSLKHFPQGDYTLVETPDVTLFHRDGTPWYITAQQGRISEANELIKLWDEVVILRDSAKDPMRMETRSLTIVPQKDIAQTQQDVVITNRAGRIDATGMVAYIDENRMSLLSNVRVRHEPIKIR